MRSRRRVLSLLGIVIIAGCDRTVTAPGEVEATIPEQQDSYAHGQREYRGHAAVPRFTLDVAVSGELAPGAPVTIRMSGVAHYATDAVQVRLALPEYVVESGRDRGEPFHVPVGERISDVFSIETSLAERGRIEEEISIVFRSPGYYRLVASMIQESSEFPIDNGVWIKDVTHLEGWLWISDDAGHYSDTFDENLFPPGTHRSPGPLREIGPPVEGDARDGDAVQPMMSTAVTYQALYYNADAASYSPIPSLFYRIYRCADPEAVENCEDWEEFAQGWTNLDGTLQFDCTDAPDEYFGTAQLHGLSLTMVPSLGPVGFQGSGQYACEQQYQIFFNSMVGHSFVSMYKSITTTNTILSTSRPPLTVYHSPSADNSQYNTSQDYIIIKTTPSDDHVWGLYGAFVHAHEYGHALHEKGLGGNPGSASCPSPHYINVPYNLKCAYSEGFANLVAVISRPDLTGYFYTGQIEINAYYPGGDGSIIEGATAAFFYDIIDPANEAHDSIAAPGAYLRDIIETCEVYVTGSGWQRADGIDHIIYCMENDVDSAVVSNFFPTRSNPPTDQREFATESSAWGWSQNAIRMLWQKNLYGIP